MKQIIVKIFVIWMTVQSLDSSMYAQKVDIGTSQILNFSKETFNGGTQTWDIGGGYKGRMYFANNDGLLQFDGQKWDKFSLPNKTIARSLAITDQQKIYVGGQDELGYFYPNEAGVLTFYSIRESIPEQDRSIEDVWEMKWLGQSLFFRSSNRIFALKNGKWKIFKGQVITFLGLTSDAVVYNDLNKGLFKIVNNESQFVEGSDALINVPIIDLIELSKDKWLIISEKQGLYLFEKGKIQAIYGKESQYLQQNIVQSAATFKNGDIVIGTQLGGALIIDEHLQAKELINKEKGLQNNSVSSLFVDGAENLWIGTYNGIDYLKLNGLYTYIYPDGDLQGAIYDIELQNGKLYCGTNNGLYFKDLSTVANPFNTQQFQLIHGTQGQVWGIDTIKSDLIMCHNEGAFLINNSTATKFSVVPGAWKFLALDQEGYVIGGFYDGLYIYRKNGKSFDLVKKIEGFSESSRIIEKQGNDIWVSHPYRGVFKITIDPNFNATIKSYGTKDGLPTNFPNYVFKLSDKITIASEVGLYLYDAEKDHFFLAKEFADQFGSDVSFKKIISHKNGLYYVSNKEVGFIKLEDKILNKERQQILFADMKDKLVGGFENLYPLDDGSVMFCTNKGIRYYQSPKKNTKLSTCYLSELKSLTKNETVHSGYHMLNDTLAPAQVSPPKFKSNENQFSFYFATTNAGDAHATRFRYYLSPIEKKWSDWQEKNDKEYNNLSSGKYTFHLQSSSETADEGPEYTYEFIVRPPWYLSVAALFAYTTLFVFALWYYRLKLVHKYEEQTTQLKAEKEESDAKIQELLNEKLEAELVYKNKELGLSTMHLVQKNETLDKLREELNKITKDVKDTEVKSKIKNLMSILTTDDHVEEDWNSFAINFDLVHTNFLKRMKETFPQLTPKDLKLCAYLKMNLSTKELAPLLNISVRGVEISRYRLRKKLELANDINLNDFMMNF